MIASYLSFSYECIVAYNWFLVFAGVAELVDALDLGSSVERRVGSNPSARTTRGDGNLFVNQKGRKFIRCRLHRQKMKH